MKLSNVQIFAYLANHPQYGINEARTAKNNLRSLLNAGQKLGLLRDRKYSSLINAPPGEKTEKEYNRWLRETRGELLQGANTRRTAMLSKEQANKRLGKSRAAELTDMLFECNGNEKKAWNRIKAGQVRVPPFVMRQQLPEGGYRFHRPEYMRKGG